MWVDNNQQQQQARNNNKMCVRKRENDCTYVMPLIFTIQYIKKKK